MSRREKTVRMVVEFVRLADALERNQTEIVSAAQGRLRQMGVEVNIGSLMGRSVERDPSCSDSTQGVV